MGLLSCSNLRLLQSQATNTPTSSILRPPRLFGYTHQLHSQATAAAWIRRARMFAQFHGECFKLLASFPLHYALVYICNWQTGHKQAISAILPVRSKANTTPVKRHRGWQHQTALKCSSVTCWSVRRQPHSILCIQKNNWYKPMLNTCTCVFLTKTLWFI